MNICIIHSVFTKVNTPRKIWHRLLDSISLLKEEIALAKKWFRILLPVLNREHDVRSSCIHADYFQQNQ